LHLHGPACDGLQLVDRSDLGFGFERGNEGECVVEYANHCGRRELFFRHKVLVEARFGDTDVGRHIVDRHRVKALFGEQPVDRRDDRVFARLQHLRLE